MIKSGVVFTQRRFNFLITILFKFFLVECAHIAVNCIPERSIQFVRIIQLIAVHGIVRSYDDVLTQDFICETPLNIGRNIRGKIIANTFCYLLIGEVSLSKLGGISFSIHTTTHTVFNGTSKSYHSWLFMFQHPEQTITLSNCVSVSF